MGDSLSKMMSIASKSLEASQYRMRNAAENMANAKSANYVPKSLEFQVKLDRKNDVNTVQLQKVKTHPELTQQIYDPSHSQADENGLVTLPKLDPLISLMNLQESKHEHERALKMYETATDMKQKMIRLMSN